MTNPIIISASPHIHSHKSTQRLMYDVLIALVPSFIVSVYVFGLGALVVTAVAVASCVFFEYFIQRFILKTESSLQDGSALITGVLLAFNLPTNLPLWMVLIGSLVAIGIAKLSFGGLGYNIFNPALVGRVFLLISFPVEMTQWPLAFENRGQYFDTLTGETTLGMLKEGAMYGEHIDSLVEKIPSFLDMLFGFTTGSAGEISVLALLFGGVYLLIRKVITWHIPISLLFSIGLLTGIFWVFDPTQYANPLIHLMSGGAVLGAFYMATDLVTSPVTKKGMVVFGLGIGVITVVIRLFGAYPEGISFGILIMNAFVPLIDKFFKPRRFGNNIRTKILWSWTKRIPLLWICH